MLRTIGRGVSAFALIAAAGCGGGDESGPEGSISVAASPASLSVEQGGSGTVTVTLTRGGGFADPVNITVDGLPAGVTTIVSPSPLTGATTSATVTVNVASTVAAGTYTATINASATGVGAATAQYTLTVTAAPNYTLSNTPATLSITAGSSATTTVNINRTNFTGAVTLSLASPPAGITATFNPAAPTGNTSTATINVATTVAAGNYNVTIMGAATGVPTARTMGIDEASAAGDRTTTVAVTVAAAPQNVVFTVAPTSLSIQQGASGTTTLNVARTGVTTNITPTITGNPTGMTVTLNPNPITANSSQVTVNVGTGVGAGTYNVVIAASGVPGNPTVTLPVTVTVPAGTSIVWEFCNTDPQVQKFWRKNAGTWAEVTGTVLGTVTRFAFVVSGSDVGVAFVQRVLSSSQSSLRKAGGQRVAGPGQEKSVSPPGGDGGASQNVAGLIFPYFLTNVLYANTTELAGQARVCATAAGTVAKQFNVTGMATAEGGALGYGPTAIALNSGLVTYNLSVVPGTFDYLAAFGPIPTTQDPARTYTGYRIGRGETAPGPVVSLNRVGATPFVSVPVVVSGGVPGSTYEFINGIQGARGSLLSVFVGSATNTSGQVNMLFLAPGDRLGTDLNRFVASNRLQIGQTTVHERDVGQYFSSTPPASVSLQIPPEVPTFTVTQVMGGAYPTWTVAGPMPSPFQTDNGWVTVSYQGGGETTVMYVSASRNWLVSQGMTTNYSLTGPAGLPAFTTAWAPPSPLFDADVNLFTSNITGGGPVAGSMTLNSYVYKLPPF